MTSWSIPAALYALTDFIGCARQAGDRIGLIGSAMRGLGREDFEVLNLQL